MEDRQYITRTIHQEGQQAAQSGKSVINDTEKPYFGLAASGKLYPPEVVKLLGEGLLDMVRDWLHTNAPADILTAFDTGRNLTLEAGFIKTGSFDEGGYAELAAYEMPAAFALFCNMGGSMGIGGLELPGLPALQDAVKEC